MCTRLEQTSSFVPQQPFLAAKSAAIAGETAVSADDAVAGDDDGHGVGAIRCAYSAHSGGQPDLPRQLAVRRCAAGFYTPKRVPDALLKVRSVHFDGYVVQRVEVPSEITEQRPGSSPWIRRPADGFIRIPLREHCAHGALIRVEMQQARLPLPRHYSQRADRSFDPRHFHHHG